ncbi:hypothetical protein SNOG_11046 [Parastagonospora nodorum SN15]|uniref:Uncharacterized protein n=1 Tax=Phaeosphaeria nodorum (strain SN15 / ATCC MYA-4574 / FGSC 10173) TaxID=321614 RepID=Q0UB18_PHANO|nr:hypothetical protein SNOG_11046 [Parastagonospora nodorum SN15]EAT81545.1 hypothetical protein SNOG_11046 [Parastagonospora nodorum SN15]
MRILSSMQEMDGSLSGEAQSSRACAAIEIAV